MSHHPFYFTWNHQRPAALFDVESANGDEFLLADGRRVFDLISTSFQANFGHSHSGICASIARQLAQMPIASPKATFALKREVSQRLLALMGLPGGKLFYTVSGSEAVENALKMARQVTGRPKILARCKSYHGASLGALSVTGDWRHEPHLTLREHTIRIPEPCEDPTFEAARAILENQGPETVAACIVETVSGTNGVAIPDPVWFQNLRETCDAYGILLIADEVLCGFGRTGRAFAFQHYDFQPDLVCLSKAISGGYIPFGAVWTGPRIAEFYERSCLTCGLTSYAHPLGLAALAGVLDILEEPEFWERVNALTTILTARVEAWRERPDVAEVRSLGLLAAVDFVDATAPNWETCFQQGLHLYSNGEMLVLAPPLITTPQRLIAALDALQSLWESPEPQS